MDPESFSCSTHVQPPNPERDEVRTPVCMFSTDGGRSHAAAYPSPPPPHPTPSSEEFRNFVAESVNVDENVDFFSSVHKINGIYEILQDQ